MTINGLTNIELCILIPCYNNFSGLVNAINSIKYYNNKYLIIVVDDGSYDPINLKKLSFEIPEIVNLKIIRLKINAGITSALNTGLNYIYNNLNVNYIARLDCGDICSFDRFYRQVEFLNKYQEIDLIGSWCYFKDDRSGQGYKFKTPTKHSDIERSMNFRNVFIHPTVMWRFKGVGKLLYPESFPYAEDYGLFYYMINSIKSAIINDYLVTCQINTEGISIKNRSLQLKSRMKVIFKYKKNKLFYFLGWLKLKMLMFIPYQAILSVKKIFLA